MPEYNHTRQALFLKHALQGHKQEALRTVTPDLIAWARWDEVWPWAMAAGYALIDEKVEALDWLEHATSRGFIHYPFLSQHDERRRRRVGVGQLPASVAEGKVHPPRAELVRNTLPHRPAKAIQPEVLNAGPTPGLPSSDADVLVGDLGPHR